MSVQYEKVTMDAGHEYIESCQVLFETQQGWLVVLSNGEEEYILKGQVSQYVRGARPLIDIQELVYRVMRKTDEHVGWELYGVEAKVDDWLPTFVDKLIETGALKAGQYEIPN